MPDDTADGRVGNVVDDRYKLTEVMAAGAMGEVYKAERVPVGKLVAVKFLHASFVSDSEFQARFDRETRVMSKLAHPNCVSVVDFGVWQDTPYLVMDFVAGETLRKRLDDHGALPPNQALAIARQITSGLAHAHEQGIIHRDVKPANIMITDEIGHGERVRILDFGLARLRGNVGRDATQTNMVVGTPNYMAPEQTVPGGTIDARTDLYALGVVLFEMIVGERPFAAEDTLALLGMHRGAPIPRLADRVDESTELPAGLQALIDQAMAKSPAARFQTAIEMANAIDDVTGLKSSPGTANPVVIEAHKKLDPKSVMRSVGSTSVGAASTQLDIDATKREPMRPSVITLDGDVPAKRSRFWRTMIAAMFLIGGTAAMAGYLIHRLGANGTATPVSQRDAAPVAFALDAARVASVTPDAAEKLAVGPADAEIEMDPDKAEDLDPSKGSADTAEDEAADAPASNEEAENKAPSSPEVPQLATNVHDAVNLIKAGHREEALASLRVLKKRSPASAYIPFLMGSLHFDKTWWSVAMDNYAEAIRKNAQYKHNPVINRNLIKMLSSPRTSTRASSFLRGVGHPAAMYLRYAAAHDPNPVVKKTAAALAKQIR